MRNPFGDLYFLVYPNFFYREVIYFPQPQGSAGRGATLRFADIFIDQVDVKLIEEQADEPLEGTQACFFFKS